MTIGADATRASIAAMLRPKSIAIAGASADRAKLGSLPLAFLTRHAYAGKIYLVHPTLEQIGGIACVRSMADIPGEVDLLVVAIGAARVEDLFNECRKGQVKSAVVISSGFAEIGPEGVRLQERLRLKALEKGIRFVGPNSVGSANAWEKIFPSISQVYDQEGLVGGPVGFVSQSGAVGTAITALAHAEKIGIGYFASTGNEGDLEFGDFCDYFAEDPEIRIIAGYVESIRDGQKFRAAAIKAALAGKPVVLIKVGASEAGGRAVQSHTGALAGADEVYRAAFDESGLIRAQSIEELIDLLKIFSAPALAMDAPRRPRVAILSHSGGAGVLMADTCTSEGMDVAPPSDTLRAALAQRLPAFASLQNPIDMTANVIFNPVLMTDTVRDVLHSGEYDAVMLCVKLIWRQGSALAEELSRLADESKCLFGVAWIAAKQDALDQLRKSGIPVFSDPVRCAKVIAVRLRWEAGRERVALDYSPPADAAQARSKARAFDDLGRYQAQIDLLRGYELDLAPGILASNAAEAKRAAASLGYPVAVKLIARNLAHKSDIGGVHLDIESDPQLDRCCAALDAIVIADKEGILVQKMTRGSLEVFVGMKRDPIFGPLVVVGLGGIYVEIMKETVMRLAPFDAAQAKRLLERAKFFPLLAGARGRAPLNVDALAILVSKVALLSIAETSILSIDLNPVIMTSSGAQIVDFKLECDE